MRVYMYILWIRYMHAYVNAYCVHFSASIVEDLGDVTWRLPPGRLAPTQGPSSQCKSSPKQHRLPRPRRSNRCLVPEDPQYSCIYIYIYIYIIFMHVYIYIYISGIHAFRSRTLPRPTLPAAVTIHYSDIESAFMCIVAGAYTRGQPTAIKLKPGIDDPSCSPFREYACKTCASSVRP